jgi:hypothetical protein
VRIAYCPYCSIAPILGTSAAQRGSVQLFRTFGLG